VKKINEGFYELAPGLYAEQRDAKWWVTDEKEQVQAGPFDSLEDLASSRVEADLDALDLSTVKVARPGDPDFVDFPSALTTVTNRTDRPEVVVNQAVAADLVTLREAAAHLPITRQGLEYHRNRGTLPVSPVVTGRSVELYSLKALKEAFPS
jgi:hypothetical protein